MSKCAGCKGKSGCKKKPTTEEYLKSQEDMIKKCRPKMVSLSSLYEFMNK